MVSIDVTGTKLLLCLVAKRFILNSE